MKRLIFLFAILSVATFSNAQLTVQAGAGLHLQTGGTLTLQGDLESNDDISGNGYVILKGTSLQTVNLHGKQIGGLNIDNENNVALATPLTITAILGLEKGNLQCGASNLNLGGAAMINGGSETSFVETNEGGEIRKTLSENLDGYLVPIGNSNEYAPLLISTVGTYNDAYIGLSSRNGVHPNKPAGTDDYLRNFWLVNRKGINGTLQATAKYTGVKGEEQNLKGFYWNGTTWNDKQSQIDTRNHAVTVSASEGRGEIYAFTPLNDRTYRMTVFPNPAKSIVTVQITSNRDMETNLLVYDMYGQIVLAKKVILRLGSNQVNLNVTKLAKGSYTIKSSAENNAHVVSLIKG